MHPIRTWLQIKPSSLSPEVKKAGPGSKAEASKRPAASTSAAASPAPSTSRSHATAGGESEQPTASAAGPWAHTTNMDVLGRFETNEITRPLLTAHFILSDVASRLLVDSVLTAVHRVGGSGGRWEGSISMHHSKKLRPGILISYWNHAVPLLSLLDPDAGTVKLEGGAAGAGAASLAVSKPIWPQLEIGVGYGNSVEVSHYPPLRAIAAAAATAIGQIQYIPNGRSPGSGSGYSPLAPSPAPTPVPEPMLVLDASKVNVDELLLRSAAFLAMHELQVLQQRLLALFQVSGLRPACSLVLRCSTSWPMVPESARPGGQDASVVSAAAAAVKSWGGGSSGASLASDRSSAGVGGASGEAGSSATSVPIPTLEFYVDNLLLVRLSKSLTSGRLLLRPGPGMSNDILLEQLGTWAAMEEDLNVTVSKVFQRSSTDTGVTGQAQHAFHEVSNRLLSFYKNQHKHNVLSRCITCTRTLRPQLGPLAKP
eukprot:gene492-1898_t